MWEVIVCVYSAQSTIRACDGSIVEAISMHEVIACLYSALIIRACDGSIVVAISMYEVIACVDRGSHINCGSVHCSHSGFLSG